MPAPRAAPAILDLATRELLRIRKNPLTPEQVKGLRGVRPAGPPPRPSAEPVRVQRRASNTPLVAFDARLKAKPIQPETPTHYRVRQDRIDHGGKVTLRYLSKLRHIPVGVAHRNLKVCLLVAGANVRIVATDGTLIRELTLDPSRSYQPLGGRWPVHNVLQQVSGMS